MSERIVQVPGGELDLSEALRVALAAAHAAGELQMSRREARGRAVDVQLKSLRELVTEIDQESERVIVDIIQRAFPEHDILAEEGSGHERQAPFRWIIDPIDGTTNYAHGLPLFCSSIALERRRPDEIPELLVAVIHAPALRETYTAARGIGARLNDEPIHVSDRAELIESLLATGFAYVRHLSPNNNMANWTNLNFQSRDLRRCGSAALDLAWVAAGRFEGYWEYHIAPYDVAAGALLVLEAGGRVTDTEGAERWLNGRRIVATNGKIHDKLIEALVARVPDPLIPE